MTNMSASDVREARSGSQLLSTPDAPDYMKLTRQHAVATRSAYAAAVLFAAHLTTYFVPSVRDATVSTSLRIAVALAVLAVAQHLVVFPVVRALRAPRWAQVAAYLWLVLDMCTDLLQLAGTPKSLYLVLRLGVNLFAALWIASASWSARGALRAVGLFVAFDFACYSCIAWLTPRAFVVTLPSLLLLPLWFALAGRALRHDEQHRRSTDDSTRTAAASSGKVG